jgi:hypothetical protein
MCSARLSRSDVSRNDKPGVYRVFTGSVCGRYVRWIYRSNLTYAFISHIRFSYRRLFLFLNSRLRNCVHLVRRLEGLWLPLLKTFGEEFSWTGKRSHSDVALDITKYSTDLASLSTSLLVRAYGAIERQKAGPSSGTPSLKRGIPSVSHLSLHYRLLECYLGVILFVWCRSFSLINTACYTYSTR